MIEDTSHTLTPKRFWILGAGHFGQIAVRRITRQIHDVLITVVDKEPIEIADEKTSIAQADGIAWLKDRLHKDAPVDMIIPAIPLHVAAQWVKLKLVEDFEIHPVRVPDRCFDALPNPMKGVVGQIFASHADFVCPDNCSEPENICTHTAKPRPIALYRILEGLTARDFLPIVIRSDQLLPGVGGLYPADMLTALDLVRTNSNRLIMIGTACKCHGVLDFMRLVPRK